MTKQSLGGKARAEKLSKQHRSDIASVAAKARWAKESIGEIPKATHPGELKIGDIRIPCAVLEDGRRVISEHGVTTALGSRSGASKRLKKTLESEGAPLPIFLAPSQLKGHINDDLLNGPLQPIVYKNGRRTIVGYDAVILPAACDVWLRARAAGDLQKQQLVKAQNAEILMSGLARVGIVALIDEATGYQNERDRDELHKLLAVYLSEERLAWAKRFPDEFYKQIYRLRKWSWPSGARRTPLLGKITNQVVYDRLPDGVLEELQSRNPVNPDTGKRSWRHHQFLSEDIGQPDLRDHLLQLIAIMRISSSWTVFLSNLKKAFPKYGDQLELEFT
ncbi:MAG: P63C domain-containing protein [Desulfobulbaceae bacterium]|nr:P63C domain-containing protein [Desulfobulbaceae bacterium]